MRVGGLGYCDCFAGLDVIKRGIVRWGTDIGARVKR